MLTTTKMTSELVKTRLSSAYRATIFHHDSHGVRTTRVMVVAPNPIATARRNPNSPDFIVSSSTRR